MTARLNCVVPFCRRTAPKREFDEWLCGDHWRLIRHPRRRAYGRYLRRWRRYGHSNGAGWRLWRTLKREAIERATGIA